MHNVQRNWLLVFDLLCLSYFPAQIVEDRFTKSARFLDPNFAPQVSPF